MKGSARRNCGTSESDFASRGTGGHNNATAESVRSSDTVGNRFPSDTLSGGQWSTEARGRPSHCRLQRRSGRTGPPHANTSRFARENPWNFEHVPIASTERQASSYLDSIGPPYKKSIELGVFVGTFNEQLRQLPYVDSVTLLAEGDRYTWLSRTETNDFLFTLQDYVAWVLQHQSQCAGSLRLDCLTFRTK